MDEARRAVPALSVRSEVLRSTRPSWPARACDTDDRARYELSRHPYLCLVGHPGRLAGREPGWAPREHARVGPEEPVSRLLLQRQLRHRRRSHCARDYDIFAALQEKSVAGELCMCRYRKKCDPPDRRTAQYRSGRGGPNGANGVRPRRGEPERPRHGARLRPDARLLDPAPPHARDRPHARGRDAAGGGARRVRAPRRGRARAVHRRPCTPGSCASAPTPATCSSPTSAPRASTSPWPTSPARSSCTSRSRTTSQPARTSSSTTSTSSSSNALAEADELPGKLWGIGIGLPGPVEFHSGRPIAPPIMPGWDRHPVRERFSDYDVPVWVDNDVNVMALGELRAASRASTRTSSSSRSARASAPGSSSRAACTGARRAAQATSDTSRSSTWTATTSSAAAGT